MADIVGLSEHDLGVLLEIVGAYRRGRLNSQIRSGEEREQSQSPDIYIAKPRDAAGIPALVGNIPGSGICDVYQLVNGAVIQVTSLDKTVYNFSTSVVQQSLVEIKRTKWGTWAVQPFVPSNDNSAGFDSNFQFCDPRDCAGPHLYMPSSVCGQCDRLVPSYQASIGAGGFCNNLGVGAVVLNHVSSCVWESDTFECTDPASTTGTGTGTETVKWTLTLGAAGFGAGSTLDMTLPNGIFIRYRKEGAWCCYCANTLTIDCATAGNLVGGVDHLGNSYSTDFPAFICVRPVEPASPCTTGCPGGAPAEWLLTVSGFDDGGGGCCPELNGVFVLSNVSNCFWRSPMVISGASSGACTDLSLLGLNQPGYWGLTILDSTGNAYVNVTDVTGASGRAPYYPTTSFNCLGSNILTWDGRLSCPTSPTTVRLDPL